MTSVQMFGQVEARVKDVLEEGDLDFLKQGLTTFTIKGAIWTLPVDKKQTNKQKKSV